MHARTLSFSSLTPLLAPLPRRRGRDSAPVWEVPAPARGARGLSWPVFLLGVVLLLLAVGGGFLYIREITSTAASGYDISTLERRAAELREQELRLEAQAAELQSLKRVEERVPKLNLVPSREVAYTAPIVDAAVTAQIPFGSIQP